MENLAQDNPIVYNDESIMLNSIITDILNDRITTANNQLSSDNNTSRRSLFKLDKTTSMHSLPEEQSNIFDDFFTQSIYFRKNHIKKS